MRSSPPLPSSGVLLALDPGSKRVGVAVSDPLQVAVRPVATLPGVKISALIDALTPLLEEHDVKGIVVGLPLLEDGTSGTQAQRAQTILHHLRRRWPELPMRLWDERWSSAAADAMLREAPPSIRALGRDAVAAAVILRGFLDAREEE